MAAGSSLLLPCGIMVNIAYRVWLLPSTKFSSHILYFYNYSLDGRMGQEERDFLQKLCDSVLNAEKTVRFAGVIDDEGKLLIGRYRSDIPSPLIKANLDKDTKATSFYSAYQALAINKRFESDLGPIRFQVTEF